MPPPQIYKFDSPVYRTRITGDRRGVESQPNDFFNYYKGLREGRLEVRQKPIQELAKRVVSEWDGFIKQFREIIWWEVSREKKEFFDKLAFVLPEAKYVVEWIQKFIVPQMMNEIPEPGLGRTAVVFTTKRKTTQQRDAAAIELDSELAALDPATFMQNFMSGMKTLAVTVANTYYFKLIDVMAHNLNYMRHVQSVLYAPTKTVRNNTELMSAIKRNFGLFNKGAMNFQAYMQDLISTYGEIDKASSAASNTPFEYMLVNTGFAGRMAQRAFGKSYEVRYIGTAKRTTDVAPSGPTNYNSFANINIMEIEKVPDRSDDTGKHFLRSPLDHYVLFDELWVHKRRRNGLPYSSHLRDFTIYVEEDNGSWGLLNFLDSVSHSPFHNNPQTRDGHWHGTNNLVNTLNKSVRSGKYTGRQIDTTVAKQQQTYFDAIIKNKSKNIGVNFNVQRYEGREDPSKWALGDLAKLVKGNGDNNGGAGFNFRPADQRGISQKPRTGYKYVAVEMFGEIVEDFMSDDEMKDITSDSFLESLNRFFKKEGVDFKKSIKLVRNCRLVKLSAKSVAAQVLLTEYDNKYLKVSGGDDNNINKWDARAIRDGSSPNAEYFPLPENYSDLMAMAEQNLGNVSMTYSKVVGYVKAMMNFIRLIAPGAERLFNKVKVTGYGILGGVKYNGVNYTNYTASENPQLNAIKANRPLSPATTNDNFSQAVYRLAVMQGGGSYKGKDGAVEMPNSYYYLDFGGITGNITDGNVGTVNATSDVILANGTTVVPFGALVGGLAINLGSVPQKKQHLRRLLGNTKLVNAIVDNGALNKYTVTDVALLNQLGKYASETMDEIADKISRKQPRAITTVTIGGALQPSNVMRHVFGGFIDTATDASDITFSDTLNFRIKRVVDVLTTDVPFTVAMQQKSRTLPGFRYTDFTRRWECCTTVNTTNVNNVATSIYMMLPFTVETERAMIKRNIDVPYDVAVLRHDVTINMTKVVLAKRNSVGLLHKGGYVKQTATQDGRDRLNYISVTGGFIPNLANVLVAGEIIFNGYHDGLNRRYNTITKDNYAANATTQPPAHSLYTYPIRKRDVRNIERDGFTVNCAYPSGVMKSAFPSDPSRAYRIGPVVNGSRVNLGYPVANGGAIMEVMANFTSTKQVSIREKPNTIYQASHTGGGKDRNETLQGIYPIATISNANYPSGDGLTYTAASIKNQFIPYMNPGGLDVLNGAVFDRKELKISEEYNED